MLYLVVCVLQPFQNQILVIHPGEGSSLSGLKERTSQGEVRDPVNVPMSLIPCSGSGQQTQAAPFPHRGQTRCYQCSPVAESRACFVPLLRSCNFLQKPLCLLKCSSSICVLGRWLLSSVWPMSSASPQSFTLSAGGAVIQPRGSLPLSRCLRRSAAGDRMCRPCTVPLELLTEVTEPHSFT